MSMSEASKQWSRENPEARNALNRASYARNVEARRAAKRTYYQENKAAFRLRERKRDSAIDNEEKAGDWEFVLLVCGQRCLCCGTSGDLTKDHVVSLVDGGRHVIFNFQPLCLSCNSSKGRKHTDYRSEDIVRRLVNRYLLSVYCTEDGLTQRLHETRICVLP